MSKKSNRKSSKKKLRSGSSRDVHQQRVRMASPSTKESDAQEQDPALMLGGETRAAEAVTTLWVLSTLATGASLAGTLFFAILNAFMEKQEETSLALQMLPQWFIMVGAITGFLGLMGNFLATRFRNFQAPFVVKLMSGMICALGLAIGLFMK